MQHISLTGGKLTLADVVAVARGDARVALADEARVRVRRGRAAVEQLLQAGQAGEPEFGITSGERVGRTRVSVEELAEGGKVAYGVTTGFGELARVQIPPGDVQALQRNLILSHACGVGDTLPDDVVRAMLLLRANSLAHGLSGVRPEVIDLIIAMLNARVHPVVPSRGSLGASGDLVPLAHCALAMIGEGEAQLNGARLPARDVLARAGLAPVVLQPKEGLALINGTQLMASLLALAVHDAWQLVRSAEIAGAMSAEALLASVRPFDARLANARPHPGHAQSAENLRKITQDSDIVASHAGCARVQDAYSLRCMPQVFGAIRQALAHAEQVLEIEFGSVTDNPLVFENGETLSGGNFHGEPLALLAAYLSPSLSALSGMSERRVARLVDPRLSEGLPPFLTARSGLNSGLMIPHYVAAALALDTHARAHPSAVASVPVSANQEDWNSNGANGALAVHEILRKAEQVVAVELLCAAQGLDFRAPIAPGRGTRAAHARVRAHVPHLTDDRPTGGEIERLAGLIRSGGLVEAVEAAVGPLA